MHATKKMLYILSKDTTDEGIPYSGYKWLQKLLAACSDNNSAAKIVTSGPIKWPGRLFGLFLEFCVSALAAALPIGVAGEEYAVSAPGADCPLGLYGVSG
jgi:hypothetical protein